MQGARGIGKKAYPHLLFFFVLSNAFAQDQLHIDSLTTQLRKHAADGTHVPSLYDTTAVHLMVSLSGLYFTNNNDSAMYYAKTALELSEKIRYQKGAGMAYKKIGQVYLNRDNYPEALKNLDASLKIHRELGNMNEVCGCYQALGYTYVGMGNLPNALSHFLSALQAAETIGQENSIATAYGGLADVYEMMGNEAEKQKYLLKSIELSEKSGNKLMLARAYAKISDSNLRMKAYEKALEYLFKALKLREEAKDAYTIGFTLYKIGIVYDLQMQFAKASDYYLKSLKIAEDKGFVQLRIAVLNAIGMIFTGQKKYPEAQKYLHQGLSLSKEIGSFETLKLSYFNLARLDSARGNFKQGWEHLQLYYRFRDSLINKENTKKVTELNMNFEFAKVQDSIRAEQSKKDLVKERELQKQKLVRNGFIGGFALVLVFAGVFFRQRNKIQAGKKRSDELLLNILPGEVADELKAKGSADAKQFDEVTVMFTDFKGFTLISERLTPAELVAEIDACFSAFDAIISKYNIEKIKTIGDSYMCAGGLPVANTTHATDVVTAALEIQQFMQQHMQQRTTGGKEVFEIRIGIHTGPVVAGIVGVKKFAYDIWGDTVNIASRMESSGEAGKVNISSNTYQWVKERFICVHRGKIHAKHKGAIDMYFVEGVSNHAG